MSHRMLRALCIVPVCAFWGCAAPPKPGDVLLTSKQTCTTDCTVPIKLEMVSVTLADGTTKMFCVGTLPQTIEFPNTAPGNSDKTITWVLDKTLVPSEDVEFQQEHGILKIGELPHNNGQFKPDDQRIDKVTFKGKNKHKVKDTQATYVPLIIRLKNGLPEVCGTADPRIQNT